MIQTKSKLISIFILIIVSTLLTSCSDSRELNTMGIVTAMGIDIENENVVITAEIFNPVSARGTSESNASTQENVRYIQGIGDTVFEAIRNVTLQFDRKMFLSHNKILILGEKFAKSGISGCMDFFTRDNEQRENAYLLIAKGAKAYEVMGVNGGISESSGIYLSKVIENFPHTGKNIKITIFEYFRYYYDISNEPVIGVVERVEKPEINKAINKGTSEASPKKYLLDVAGGAALNNGYLIGYLTGDEMIGFNFIVNDIDTGLIVFKVPQQLDKRELHMGKQGEFAVMEILQSNSKNEISIVNDKIHLTINVKIKGSLGEDNVGVDVSDPEIRKGLEMACSEKIKELISATMDKGQKEFKQDNFSIGVSVHQQYPELWKDISKDWHNIFQYISYSVNVETHMVRTNLTSIPSNTRKGR